MSDVDRILAHYLLTGLVLVAAVAVVGAALLSLMDKAKLRKWGEEE